MTLADRDPVEPYLDIDQLSAWLNVPKSWVYSRTRRPGGIPHRKIGKYLRFSPDEIRAWVEAGCPVESARTTSVGR